MKSGTTGFVDEYVRLTTLTREHDTRGAAVAASGQPSAVDPDQLQIEFDQQTFVAFPTQAHAELSRLLAGATDEELLALANSGHFCPEMYPRSNGSRGRKLLNLLQVVREVHQHPASMFYPSMLN